MYAISPFSFPPNIFYFKGFLKKIVYQKKKKKKRLQLVGNTWQKKEKERKMIRWITCIGFAGEAFLVHYAPQWLILIGSLILHYCALWLNAFLLDLQGDLKHYWPRETDKGNQLSPPNCTVLAVTVNVACYLLWVM